MQRKEQRTMRKRVTVEIDEKDADGIKKLAEKLGAAQAEIFRTALKMVLKMKVADQKAMFPKK